MPDSEFTPTTEQASRAYVTGMRQAFIASAGEHEEEFARFLAARDASVRAAALDEAAVVAEADAAKWEIRWQDSDREESAVGRMYAAYRDTALALASAIRALKEEKK